MDTNKHTRLSHLQLPLPAEEGGVGPLATPVEKRGVVPLKSEVQLGKRTGGKRGAPFGNKNRLVHGRWSKARIADDKKLRALLRKTRHLIIRVNMVVRARRAFLALVKKRAKAISSITQLLRGPWVLGAETARQLTRILSMLNRIVVHDSG